MMIMNPRSSTVLQNIFSKPKIEISLWSLFPWEPPNRIIAQRLISGKLDENNPNSGATAFLLQTSVGRLEDLLGQTEKKHCL